MVGLVTRWCRCGLLLSALGAVSGCGGVLQVPLLSDLEDTTGGEGSRGGDEGRPAAGVHETPIGDDGGFSDCGSRTVVAVPGPGFVEMESSFQLDAMPADSPLLKVIFGGISCQQQFDLGDVAILYEVGQQGEVLSLVTLIGSGDQQFFIRTDPPFNQRFVVTDGCLTLESDISDQDMLPDFDPTEIPEGPCRPGQLAIGQEGHVVGQPEGDHICIQAGSMNPACQDCWVEDGAWHMEFVVSGSYVALGSIDNVSVAGWSAVCNQPDRQVSIVEGDRVDFTWTTGATYRTSPSLEDLGYEAFELPSLP